MSTSITAHDVLHRAPLAADLRDGVDQFDTGRASIDFRYLTAAIRANVWLITAIVAAALAIALVATLLQTKRYTASSTVQINDSSGGVLGSKEDLPGDSMPSYDIDRTLKTQTDIVQSRGLALRVAQKLNLVGNARLYEAQGMKAPPPGSDPQALRDQAASLLTGNLTVRLPRDSRIVAISYESSDRELSAQVANAYAGEFIQSNLQRKFDSSSYARSFLGEQLDEAKLKLENSERALNAYARAAGIIRTGASSVDGADGKTVTDRGSSITSASMQQLNAAANDATARRIEAEGRWRAVSSGPLLSSPLVLANSTVITLLTEKARVEAQLSQDRANHLPDYPSVRAKQAELTTLNQQLNSVASNVRNSVRSDYQAALSVERSLQSKVGELKAQTMTEQDRSVQYNLLAREADTNRQLYEGLLERFKTLNAVAGVSLSNVSIIDNAEVPKTPSSPNLLKNLLFGLILGVGLASLIVFFKSQFDDAIRVPEDIDTKLGLPLLGVIPQAPADDVEQELADPKSAMSEAYNSLRGSLLYSTSEGLPQIMLVTSAQASEGKTTSSMAIAAGLARMGRRVLLIDADMRRPSLHGRFKLPNEHGLSTLLTSHEPLASHIAKTPQDNLMVLVAGPIPPSPTELLSTSRMEGIFQEAASNFDVVVVDSPPILGLADSPLMSALVDGVIFVVEAERSRHGSLKAALRRLRAMRPVLLGTVLTKFNPLKAGNRYSEYYGAGYYQYEHTDGQR